ncbi:MULTISPECIES: hypothetical protein [Aliiruegeria]|uniref:hypothetical protein n=1 Tax=Aliiruegeria TaxID=2854181 RepID=UPI001114357A|nr:MULTISPECIES: hypothetical protein [Aliiruegeria]NDR55679.1 hypothetical protein [Pseudoruegeria sp. M32A2M]
MKRETDDWQDYLSDKGKAEQFLPWLAFLVVARHQTYDLPVSMARRGAGKKRALIVRGKRMVS